MLPCLLIRDLIVQISLADLLISKDSFLISRFDMVSHQHNRPSLSLTQLTLNRLNDCLSDLFVTRVKHTSKLTNAITTYILYALITIHL